MCMNDSMYEGTKYLVSHDYDYDATTTDDVSFDSIYLICTAELFIYMRHRGALQSTGNADAQRHLESLKRALSSALVCPN